MPITGRDDEFRGTIAAIYADELGRDPDPGGMATFLNLARNGWTGELIRAAIHDSPEGVAYRARPKPPPVPHLEIRGQDFLDATGSRLVFNGVDAFCAFRQFLDGVDLTPFFQESREIGFNLWRVFLMGSIRQNTVMQLDPRAEPAYYDRLRPFADLLNAHGIVLLATVFVDAQDIFPDLAQRQTHWRAVTDRLRGSATIVSGGNEAGKNGFDPNELSDPGLIWSRGSGLSDQTIPNRGASASEFHPVRGEHRTLMDAVASVFGMRDLGCTGLLWLDEPLGFADASIQDKRSNNPTLAWQLARIYATFWNLAVFHNDNGQRGQLMSPTIRACAEAWTKGMRL